MGVPRSVTELSAHQLVQTRDCTRPGCPKEADGADGLCSEHRSRPRQGHVIAPPLGVRCPTCKVDTIPNTFTGACVWCGTPLEQPAVKSQPAAPTLPAAHDESVLRETERKETSVELCKIDGCTRPSAGKGGGFARMCQQHISKEISRRHAVRKSRTVKTPAVNLTTVAPKPTEQEREAPPGGLTDLARAVDLAASDLAAARERHTAALQALRAALDREAA